LRRVPFYVARIACGFSDLGGFERARLPRRRVMLEAVRFVGLQLRVFVESCYVCPLCGLGAEGGRRRFKDKRGLYNHMVRKHYGDLMELVISITNRRR
jgi:hypothetical protein